MQSEPHTTWPLPAAELKPALELALAVAHADMGVLMLHDDTVGALFPALGFGLTDDQCESIGTYRSGVAPFGLALSERRRVVVRDAWRPPEPSAELAHRLGFRGIEILPLFGTNGQAVGAIGVMFRHGRGSHRHGIRLVECCAQLIIAAVGQARQRAAADAARDAAEQIGRAKIQFLARMSHELRTPLQSIAGYVDLLRINTAEPLSPGQSRLLDRVRDGERILVHVIDDLITFSRIEAGHVTYRLDDVAAVEAMRVAETVVAPLATDRGVQLDVRPCAPGTVVIADADKLKQVLVNLTANAVKFTGRSGVVTLSCRVDADTVSFDVADNGPGIAQDQLRGIFEPYVQLSPAFLDRFGGSGLGLAISREFATGMHGELTVTSAVGHGSVFTLRLPRAALPR